MADRPSSDTSKTVFQAPAFVVARDAPPFTQRQFSKEDLKHLAIETIDEPELYQLALRLAAVCNRDGDGVIDNQQVFNVPLEAAPKSNLRTETGVGSGERPVEQKNLLFSIEVAYFIAQIAFEVDQRQLFTDALANEYRRSAPQELLYDWVRSGTTTCSIAEVEDKRHWQTVVGALNDAMLALEKKLAEEEKETTEAKEEEPAAAKDAGEPKDESAAKKSESGSAAATGEGGGDGAAATTTETPEPEPSTSLKQPKTTVPAALLRDFLDHGGGGLAANKEFLRSLQGVGFTSDERRLIVDQTAWVYAGVLAQMYPNALGRLDLLDPAARAQVNQIVRDYMLRYGKDPAALRRLIANPLARRELIFDILAQHSAQLSVLAGRDQARFTSDLQHLNREQIIGEQVRELQEYLIAQAGIEGTVLSPEEARLEAYNTLSTLSDKELTQLAAGISGAKIAIYDRATKESANEVLLKAIDKLTVDFRQGKLETNAGNNIILQLNALIANESAGTSVTDIVDIVGGLPAPELLALVGLSGDHALSREYVSHIETLRNAIQYYVQARAIAFNIPLETAQRDGARPQTPKHLATGSSGAPTPLTPKDLHDEGVENVATQRMGTTAQRSLAFFKHYYERWEALTVDEQAVVYILSDKGVPSLYLKSTPPTEKLPPEMGFIELESQVHSDVFQECVARFARNRAAFRNASARSALNQYFRNGGGVWQVVLPEKVEKAAAFEEKYRSSWATLSYEEKVTIYLIAGLPVKPGQELKVIYPYIELAPLVGRPEFNALVQKVHDNPAVVSQPNQREAFTALITQQNIDLTDSKRLAGEKQREIAAALEAYAAMPLESQEKIAQEAGFINAAQYQLLLQQAQAGEIFPQEFSFTLEFVNDDGGVIAAPLINQHALWFADSIEEDDLDEHAAFLSYSDADPAYAASPAGYRARRLPSGRKISRFRKRLRATVKKTKEAITKATQVADKAIGAAIKAIPYVGVPLSLAWNNKWVKRIVGGALALLAALLAKTYLQAIATPFGMAGAVLGGIAGGFFGNALGAAIGSYAGAMAGLWVNNALGWGNMMDWFTGGGGASTAAPAAGAGVGAGAAAGTLAPTGASAAAAGTGAVAAGAAAGAIKARAVVVASTMSGAVAWLMYTLGFIGLVSIVVMTVIWGAFIAPSPTEPLPPLSGTPETQASAKYLTVTKTVNPNKVENNTPSGELTYTITVQPQPGYRIDITGFTDEYSSFGGKGTPKITSPAPPTYDDFKAKLLEHIAANPGGTPPNPGGKTYLTDAFTYTVKAPSIQGVDTFFINRVKITFDAYNFLSENPIETTQSYSASATVTIGTPKVGCWPTSGQILSVPFAGIDTHIRSDSYDISGNPGFPVYATFPGTACTYTGWNDGYGNHVWLYVDGSTVGYPGQTFIFIFAHLHAFAPDLQGASSCGPVFSNNPTGGKLVAPGDVLGFVGSTGNSTGPHLHFELRSNLRGAQMGGAYQSLLQYLLPNGPSLQLYDNVTTCY